MASQQGVALVGTPVNLSGQLFAKTDTSAPLFNMIGSSFHSARTFLTGATFDLGQADPANPVAGISEQDSLTAPEPEFWTRENAFNVTQIFQRSIQTSYRKTSNSSDLDQYTAISSIPAQPPIAGQTNNVPSEHAWQLTNMLASIRGEIENCIINGTFNDSQGVATDADQTRGLLEATVSNVMTTTGTPELQYDHLYDMTQEVILNNPYFDASQYVVIMNYVQFKQAQKICADEGLRIVPNTLAGVNVYSVVTPFGVLNFMPHKYMPAGTVEFACMPILRNALQPVPGKGNFFYEELAKVGASDHGQIYGQWGLDHGPEFMHGKITGLATTTEPLTQGRVVTVSNLDEIPAGGGA